VREKSKKLSRLPRLKGRRGGKKRKLTDSGGKKGLQKDLPLMSVSSGGGQGLGLPRSGGACLNLWEVFDEKEGKQLLLGKDDSRSKTKRLVDANQAVGLSGGI